MSSLIPGSASGSREEKGAHDGLPSHISWRYSCTNRTAIAPSPTADATRLTDSGRTSPAAKTPARLVSSKNGCRELLQKPVHLRIGLHVHPGEEHAILGQEVADPEGVGG